MQSGTPGGEPSLRDSFGDKLELGCALGGRLPDSLTPQERALVAQHFGSITPENCMKPEPIHPEPTRFDFDFADALVAFAEQHRLRVVGHTLCWHQQSPAWFFEPNADALTPAERLRAHITRVVGRYRGRVQAWDVVNEAVSDTEGVLRDTPWLRALGPGYLRQAFESAHAADPDAELYYNDYNLERPEKRARALELLQQLLDRGVRLDGVGIQGHWILDQVPFDDIEASIEAYSALGLKVMFTELDLDVIERPDCSADIALQRAYSIDEDRYRSGCPPEVLARQAEQYERLFRIFYNDARVTRATFWGLTDGRSWLNTWPGVRTNHPLLFDRAAQPKPAFWQVLDSAKL